VVWRVGKKQVTHSSKLNKSFVVLALLKGGFLLPSLPQAGTGTTGVKRGIDKLIRWAIIWENNHP
jgi:hypothetical protein